MNLNDNIDNHRLPDRQLHYVLKALPVMEAFLKKYEPGEEIDGASSSTMTIWRIGAVEATESRRASNPGDIVIVSVDGTRGGFQLPCSMVGYRQMSNAIPLLGPQVYEMALDLMNGPRRSTVKFSPMKLSTIPDEAAELLPSHVSTKSPPVGDAKSRFLCND